MSSTGNRIKYIYRYVSVVIRRTGLWFSVQCTYYISFISDASYCWTLLHSPFQKITPFDGWNDYLIKNIQNEYLDIFNYYEQKIAANIDVNTSNVLLTHHVPDDKLNAHEPNWYNFYSGSKDLLTRLNFPQKYMNYAICGHTHKNVKGQLYPNFCGVNVGNDFSKLAYYKLELPDKIEELS